ncbi:GyrI-like domain-containing protein [Falsibacillus albus]|uniref:AraC family transcriptional regulator n=1 Tax=Falsibacillus albus TaxID=2478915 RepID=A0A3L7JNC5_9BACI|nr:GyrI-like domain-containing protein [Falsibacillus albus]RLQ92327.1 AraC family transcriptional regulator [Falsibacillus albus]
MEPRIKIIQEKKLIGMHKEMTLSEDTTFELWRTFMQNRRHIENRVDDQLYNLKIFPKGIDFMNFSPHDSFQKWAAVEVRDFDQEKEEFEPFTLSTGQYAVFIHKGRADTFPQTLQYIFGEWLPASSFQLDDRPHFERFTKEHDRSDPEVEEEVWIPIK